MIPHHGGNRLLSAIVLLLLVLSTGCARKTTVVLLPDPDGRVGRVTVSTDAGSQEISRAQEATVVKGREVLPTTPRRRSGQEIEAEFSAVLTMLPSQPVHFILYFELESTNLTAQSEKNLPKILQSIADRNSQNVSVVGHTDTAGDGKFNLQLSQRRAFAVSNILIGRGVDPAYIKSTSHGEENPLVKTGDNVHEPKNRRVEVVVR